MSGRITIDTAAEFPHLHAAPIREAILEIRAVAEEPVDWEAVTPALQAELPEYTEVERIQAFGLEVSLRPPQAEQEVRSQHDPARSGVRFRTDDQRRIGQFQQSAFLFSYLAPYPGWQAFRDEALRLWQVHERTARPGDVLRLGLRFVNRIPLPREERPLEHWLLGIPRPPMELDVPLVGFMQRDSYRIPGYPYFVNIVTSAQAAVQDGEVSSVILDIDVFAPEPGCRGAVELEQRLAEMRWIKNRAFFGRISRALREVLS